MPVNLLPQTPPQTHADPRAASKVDDAGNDAPSFSAALSAVANSHAPKPAHANAGSMAPPRENANEARPAHVITQEELAALLMPGAAPASVDPAIANAAPRTKELCDATPLADDKTPAPALADAPTVTVPALALVTPTIPASTPAPSTAPSAREVGDVMAPRSDTKAAPRMAIERAPLDPVAPETQELSPRITIATAAKDATTALREPHEQKPLRPVDTATAPTANDVRAMGSPPPPVPVQITIATPAFTPAWRDEVTQQLAQLVVMRQDRAEIRLHPADLGPISVQIQMDGGQANLLIQAPQPATRDGLELALPQLRDSLAQQGITLGETSIRDQRDPNSQSGDRPAPYAGTTARDATTAIDAPVRVKLGLVDLFA